MSNHTLFESCDKNDENISVMIFVIWFLAAPINSYTLVEYK